MLWHLRHLLPAALRSAAAAAALFFADDPYRYKLRESQTGGEGSMLAGWLAGWQCLPALLRPTAAAGRKCDSAVGDSAAWQWHGRDRLPLSERINAVMAVGSLVEERKREE